MKLGEGGALVGESIDDSKSKTITIWDQKERQDMVANKGKTQPFQKAESLWTDSTEKLAEIL